MLRVCQDSGTAIRRFSSPLYLSRYDTKGLPLIEPVPLTSNVWQIVAAPTFQTVAESGYVPSGTEKTIVNIGWSIGVLVEEISRNNWWVQHRWGSVHSWVPPPKVLSSSFKKPRYCEPRTPAIDVDSPFRVVWFGDVRL